MEITTSNLLEFIPRLDFSGVSVSLLCDGGKVWQFLTTWQEISRQGRADFWMKNPEFAAYAGDMLGLLNSLVSSGRITTNLAACVS